MIKINLHYFQVKRFIIFAWCDILKPENRANTPIIRMELTFDDNKMQFYPQVNHVRDLLISVVEKIAVSLPSVS